MSHVQDVIICETEQYLSVSFLHISKFQSLTVSFRKNVSPRKHTIPCKKVQKIPDVTEFQVSDILQIYCSYVQSRLSTRNIEEAREQSQIDKKKKKTFLTAIVSRTLNSVTDADYFPILWEHSSYQNLTKARFHISKNTLHYVLSTSQ